MSYIARVVNPNNGKMSNVHVLYDVLYNIRSTYLAQLINSISIFGLLEQPFRFD